LNSSSKFKLNLKIRKKREIRKRIKRYLGRGASIWPNNHFHLRSPNLHRARHLPLPRGTHLSVTSARSSSRPQLRRPVGPVRQSRMCLLLLPLHRLVGRGCQLQPRNNQRTYRVRFCHRSGCTPMDQGSMGGNKNSNPCPTTLPTTCS
jgi:hypothetical protein